MAIGDPRWATTAAYSVFVSFAAVAIWSCVPLTIRLLVTLKRHKGLYFWSIIVCAWGLSIRQLGYVLNFLVPSSPFGLGDVLAQGGWVAMVTGFSIVLYSRLNLILDSRVVRRRVLWMIIINGCIFHPMMITLSIGQDVIRHGFGNKKTLPIWARINSPCERIQIIVFSAQETVITLFYVRAASQYLRSRFVDPERTRRVMCLLLGVQVIIVLLDIAVIAIDFAGLLELKLFIHSFVYAVKLELEFVVLNQLVELSKIGVPGFSSLSIALQSVSAKNKVDLEAPNLPASKNKATEWPPPGSAGFEQLRLGSPMSFPKPSLYTRTSSALDSIPERRSEDIKRSLSLDSTGIVPK